MRFSQQLASALLGASSMLSAMANMEIEEDISFGQHGSIWTSDHNQVIGYHLSGENGYQPAVLSDRVVLTNMHVGNIRAAMWSEYTQRDEEWTASLDFRVTGPDHGTGNLQLWYVKDKHAVDTASIYSAGKFDGLAIAIDQTGGHGGTIRAYLNDGTTSYKDHHNVEKLAFGQCNFAYRNLGRWLHLEIKQTKHNFELEIDHSIKCLHTGKVREMPDCA
jgi:mannose-binding lectin 1